MKEAVRQHAAKTTRETYPDLNLKVCSYASILPRGCPTFRGHAVLINFSLNVLITTYSQIKSEGHRRSKDQSCDDHIPKGKAKNITCASERDKNRHVFAWKHTLFLLHKHITQQRYPPFLSILQGEEVDSRNVMSVVHKCEGSFAKQQRSRSSVSNFSGGRAERA